MTYLIDGHNLIGRLPDIDLDDPNDEALLVRKLNGFCARTGRRCVVIFDHGLPGGKSRLSTSQVMVIFAPHTSNADRLMIARIRGVENPKEWTVVSSDREVLNVAQQRKIEVLKSFEFAALLRRPITEKPGMDVAVDIRLSPLEVEAWLQIFKTERKEQR
ncbi:MAG: NYN domain-containing protein [Armatimonadetes bacterium]|nr:NYN domain-containing protein [Anaerolineae bacterium]